MYCCDSIYWLYYQAKLLHSQQGHEEFAVTEIGKPIGRKPLQELHLLQQGSQLPGEPKPHMELCRSQCDPQLPQASFGMYDSTFDESSFLPFHDSMQASSSFRRPCNNSSLAGSRKAVGRKPLQELQRSHPPQTSFGAYEGTFDESSFMPYHDSMHASCENPHIVQDRSPRQYSVPLGAPIVHKDQLTAICEQTFTQFDIAHPKNVASVSTPRTVSYRRGILMLILGLG